MASRLCVATLNCRNTADRWRQRRHLLVEQLARLEADVIGLQELRRWPSQVGWITRRLNEASPGSVYVPFPAWKTGVWGLWEGLALLSRLPVVETGWLALGGDNRVANRVRLALPGGDVVDAYCAHLSARAANEEVRVDQAGRLLDWMKERPGGPQVLVGDLNARPWSPTLELLGRRLRSAYVAVHGSEPPRTTPTPLRALPGTRGVVIDYILVNDRIDVVEAAVTFDQPSPTDPRLYASDHFGLAATVMVDGP